MRLLWADDAHMVIEHLNKLLEDKTFNPFVVESEHSTRILSGEEEGVFAWLSTNYLSGTFSSRRGTCHIMSLLYSFLLFFFVFCCCFLLFLFYVLFVYNPFYTELLTLMH